MKRALIILLMAAVTRAFAEPADTMLGPGEAEGLIPAGPWQGNWLLRRDDPRIRTRGGSEALRLHVIHDAGSDVAELQWVAGPAVCEDPVGEPCEWIGAAGEVRALINETGLYAVLPVSADETDPLILHLPRAATDTPATLFSARGDLRYVVILNTD